jgi:sugar phosphate isomerase/epimerase
MGALGQDGLQLSCADSTFPKLSHGTALAVIRDLGIRAVDVCVFAGYSHCPPAFVAAAPERAADEALARIDHVELAIADVFAILGTSFDELAINHPDAAARAESFRQFEHLVTFCRRLGAPGLTLLPGTTFEGVDDDASLALAARELRRRIEIAGEADLRLAIEPHYESVVATPDRARDLLEQVPGLGIALDYSHFVFQGIAETEIDPLLAYTSHLHVRPARPAAMQTRAHEGTIDFTRIRDRLLADGYTGYFALEYQWEDGWLDEFTRVDCIAETAAMRDILLGIESREGQEVR